MDEMADSGGGVSKLSSSSVSPQNKGSKNKRKLADPSLGSPINNPSSLTEFPQYELSSRNFQIPLSDLEPLEVESNQSKEELVVEEFQSAEWDDPIAGHLEDLLASNLTTVFRNAIKQIVECGYSEDIAEKAVSRCGLYYGGKDLVLNIVNDTLAFLKEGKDIDFSRAQMFENLQQLVEYTMLEMISVLKEVKPLLSVAEAMWWLLMCDLNISQACQVEGDKLSDFSFKAVSGESSSDSALPQLKSESQNSETVLPNPNEPNISESTQNIQHETTLTFGSVPNLPLAHEGLPPEKEYMVSMTDNVEKFLGATGECVRTVSQTSASDEKSGAGRKGRKKKELPALRQKSLQLEKNRRGYGKGAFKSGKYANIGGFVVEKRQKSPSELPSAHMKTTSSKISIEVGPLAPLADGSCNVSSNTSPVLSATDNSSTKPMKGTVRALPAANAKLAMSSSSEKKPAPKSEASTSEPPSTPDFYAGIPYDKLQEKYVPRDEKDELILRLAPRVQELQNELNSWTEWANQKVMQAARRLSKDQPELKSLRQERAEAEQFKKEKQILEDNTTKRLSEMEFAMNNATNLVERANSTASKLEVEQTLLKMEMEAAKLRAAKSATSYQEALEREQKALKNAQSWDGQKSLLQEELETDKQKVTELQQQVNKAKNLRNQTEARWKQERMAKEKLLAQAASIRKERERLEEIAKAEEDMIKQKAEIDMQKYEEDIKKLESELAELKLKADSSKIAALRRGIDGSYGSSLTDSKVANMAMKGNQNPTEFSRVGNFQDNFGTKGLRQERECVMCLSAEKIVVFFPCAHQVLCAKCNELHYKQGMMDCPSCRTPIRWRIQARFADS